MIVAILVAVATTSTSQTVRGIASNAVNASLTAALVWRSRPPGSFFGCWCSLTARLQEHDDGTAERRVAT